MTPIDLLNWVGCRRRLRPLGVVLHWLALRVRLSTLVRCAGRRLVTASAGAPAILLTHPSMEGALKDPALLYEAMRFSVEEMKLDALCLVADMSLEAEACGCLVQYNDRDLPMVISHPLEGDGDVDDLGCRTRTATVGCRCSLRL
jgi:uroporphyrinogen-III decarboxylase